MHSLACFDRCFSRYASVSLSFHSCGFLRLWGRVLQILLILVLVHFRVFDRTCLMADIGLVYDHFRVGELQSMRTVVAEVRE